MGPFCSDPGHLGPLFPPLPRPCFHPPGRGGFYSSCGVCCPPEGRNVPRLSQLLIKRVMAPPGVACY